jgi:4-hydroxyphenylpyruvate dioxygenase
MSLGIIGIDSYEFIVADLARSRRFYVDTFDFREVAVSTPDALARTGDESAVFKAGKIHVQVTTPRTTTSRAARYLAWHPDGIPQVTMRVKDLAQTWAELEKRGATFIADPQEEQVHGGRWKSFAISTALGDVQFRFVERDDDAVFGPGLEPVTPADEGNRFRFMAVDHITVNVLTLEPWVTWLRDVMGFEPYWDVTFHTDDIRKGSGGTGLKSLVYRSPEGNVRFAGNEPLRPNFAGSQIAKFVDDHRGAGIQHVAFITPEIIPAIGTLTERGVRFLKTPASYYRALPERFAKVGLSMSTIKEPMDVLERLGIQIDGGNERYMLQIFMQEGGLLYGDPKAGPFFYEIIQRAGDPGFGYGNFRALFESIERDQLARQVPTPAA